MPPRSIVFEDDFNDDGTQPYREGNEYICRNCAVSMRGRTPLCRDCRKRTTIRQEYGAWRKELRENGQG